MDIVGVTKIKSLAINFRMISKRNLFFLRVESERLTHKLRGLYIYLLLSGF